MGLQRRKALGPSLPVVWTMAFEFVRPPDVPVERGGTKYVDITPIVLTWVHWMQPDVSVEHPLAESAVMITTGASVL